MIDLDAIAENCRTTLEREVNRYNAVCQARGQIPESPTGAAFKRQKVLVERLLAESDSEIASPDHIWDWLAHKTRSCATWFSYRAALLAICRAMLGEELTAWEAALSNPALLGENELGDLAETCQSWAGIIAACPSGCPIEDRKKRLSKRDSLKGLPQDWPEQILMELSDKWKPAWTLAVLSGARPVELARGVDVAMAGDVCTVGIAGAKVSTTKGQPFREITFLPADSWLDVLSQMVGRYQLPDSTDAFSEAVRRASRRLWPKRKQVVSAYSARHLAASRWKIGGDAAATAKAMGHSVLSTQSRYGHRKMGKGGERPNVTASREPRDDRSPRRFPELEPTNPGM